MRTIAECLAHTSRVTLELSNQCQMSRVHKLCPAYRATECVILPRKQIADVLGTLAALWGDGKKKTVAFHCYNEPIIDPRLFLLMNNVRHWIPQVGIRICSNGEYMSRDLFLEMIDAGATRIVFSAYSQKRYEELAEITRKPHGTSVRVHHVKKLDGRDFNWATKTGVDDPCGAPLDDLMIRASGNVGLCCYDCRESVVFGNLNENTFAEIMQAGYDVMRKAQEELKAGDRSRFGVCHHCQSHR